MMGYIKKFRNLILFADKIIQFTSYVAFYNTYIFVKIFSENEVINFKYKGKYL